MENIMQNFKTIRTTQNIDIVHSVEKWITNIFNPKHNYIIFLNEDSLVLTLKFKKELNANLTNCFIGTVGDRIYLTENTFYSYLDFLVDYYKKNNKFPSILLVDQKAVTGDTIRNVTSKIEEKILAYFKDESYDKKLEIRDKIANAVSITNIYRINKTRNITPPYDLKFIETRDITYSSLYRCFFDALNNDLNSDYNKLIKLTYCEYVDSSMLEKIINGNNFIVNSIFNSNNVVFYENFKTIDNKDIVGTILLYGDAKVILTPFIFILDNIDINKIINNIKQFSDNNVKNYIEFLEKNTNHDEMIIWEFIELYLNKIFICYFKDKYNINVNEPVYDINELLIKYNIKNSSNSSDILNDIFNMEIKNPLELFEKILSCKITSRASVPKNLEDYRDDYYKILSDIATKEELNYLEHIGDLKIREPLKKDYNIKTMLDSNDYTTGVLFFLQMLKRNLLEYNIFTENNGIVQGFKVTPTTIILNFIKRYKYIELLEKLDYMLSRREYVYKYFEKVLRKSTDLFSAEEVQIILDTFENLEKLQINPKQIVQVVYRHANIKDYDSSNSLREFILNQRNAREKIEKVRDRF